MCVNLFELQCYTNAKSEEGGGSSLSHFPLLFLFLHSALGMFPQQAASLHQIRQHLASLRRKLVRPVRDS